MPEKTVDRIPAAQRDMYEKGLAALQKNNLDYAVTLLLQVLKNEPGFYDCREALRAAQHKRAGGRGGGLFKRFLGSAQTLTKGRLALRSNPLDAILVAEEALNDDPSNVAAHELLAEAALLSGLPRTALLSLEVAFKANPAERRLAEKLAEAHAQLGNKARAEKILRDLLAADPADPALNEKLKNLLAARTLAEGGYEALADGSGSYRDILRDKEQAKSLEQENREVKDADVVARLVAENEARLTADPGNQRLMRSLAELNLRRGDHEAAIAWLERLLAAGGLNDPAVLAAIRDARMAQFAAREKALDAAAPDHAVRVAEIAVERDAFQFDDARRRAEANPTDLVVRYELGELHLRAGRVGEAIAELQKAQNNPNRRIPAMLLLAKAFARRGMNDLAARKLQEAIREKQVFDEEAKELRYTLGTVFEAMGKRDLAMEEFKVVYEQDIGYRDVMARVDAYYAAGTGQQSA